MRVASRCPMGASCRAHRRAMVVRAKPRRNRADTVRNRRRIRGARGESRSREMSEKLPGLGSMATAMLMPMILCGVLGFSCAHAFAQSELQADDNKAAPKKAAPRLGAHPDFSGYWKGTRDTRPGGNIGKDLPGFKLPLTPAGEA